MIAIDVQPILDRFTLRWDELKAMPDIKDACRRRDPALDDINLVSADKIERYGRYLVYPSPSFQGWYDVRDEGSDLIVSFATELAHRNAVAWAKRMTKRDEL